MTAKCAKPEDYCAFQFLHGAIGCMCARLSLEYYTFISIPTWCDWMFYQGKLKGFDCEFQFLHGAIGCSRTLKSLGRYTHFNSYMVRLDEILLKSWLILIFYFNS